MKNFNKSYLFTGFVLGFIILISFLKSFPELFEKIFINGVFPYYTYVLRFIIGKIPFSISEIIYIGFMIAIPIIIFKQLKTKHQQHKLLSASSALILINWTAGLYLFYLLIWGVNYDRKGIGKQLQLKKDTISKENLIQLAAYFIQHTNSLVKYNHNRPWEFENLKQETIQNYTDFAKSYPSLSYNPVSIKKMLFPKLWSTLGIEGYYNPVSAEANVNQDLVPWVQPFIMSHEVAHQFGIAYEDEANLLGYVVSKDNKNPKVQYSAYYAMLRYVLLELAYTDPDTYPKLFEKINLQTKLHFTKESEYWKAYNGQMSNMMSLTFDSFLKWNNQEAGIKSYSLIIYWLWDMHKGEINKNSTYHLNATF